MGSTFENVIARDFGAEGPWQKLGTDVTEFKVAGAKAYWAPVLDFCTKEIVASDISTSPDLAQQHRMLDRLLEALPDGAAPTMHSDMGWQYQHESYTSRLEGAGITQSMSRKGNCIDNAATEQLFGHVKDEFYRGMLASIYFSPFSPTYFRQSRQRGCAGFANADAPLSASRLPPPSRPHRRWIRPSGGTTVPLS